jgi:outer membrane protein TolC
VSYQIDLFGRIKHSIEAARADEEATQATIGAVKVTLAAAVARAYIGVCGANEDRELAEQALELQGHALDVAKRLQAAGRTSTVQVTEAEARYAQLRALIPGQKARAQAALYQLAYLMGRAPTEYPREAEGCNAIPQLKNPLPVGDGAALLRRRPDVHAAERRLAGATARIKVATSELYPTVGIGFSGGSFGFLKDLGKAAASMWSASALIRWNIPMPRPAPGCARQGPRRMRRWPNSMAWCWARCAKRKRRSTPMLRTATAPWRSSRRARRRIRPPRKHGVCAKAARAHCWPISAGGRARSGPRLRS